MKLSKDKITKCLWFLSLILTVCCMSFVGKNFDKRFVDDIEITIETQDKNLFLNDSLLAEQIRRDPIFTDSEDVNFMMKNLERDLKKDPYIFEVDVYKDVLSVLHVKIKQRQPIARIIRDMAPDAYVSYDGEVMPLHDQYVARVMVVTGDYTDHLLEDNADKLRTGNFLEMLKFIFKDDFLKAQIAQMDINRKGEIIIYPQIGKQKILLGTVKDYQEKLKKLKLVFLNILPKKGWNKYDKVDLRFSKQIICE